MNQPSSGLRMSGVYEDNMFDLGLGSDEPEPFSEPVSDAPPLTLPVYASSSSTRRTRTASGSTSGTRSRTLSSSGTRAKKSVLQSSSTPVNPIVRVVTSRLLDTNNPGRGILHLKTSDLVRVVMQDGVIDDGTDVKGTMKAAIDGLDINQVFSSASLPLVRRFLESPILELISLVPPRADIVTLDSNGRSSLHGHLFLYDSRCPGYLQDNMKWRKTKMSVKQIVYNERTCLYRLKNHKTDEGVPVLRRQTWQGDGEHEGWRRHVYKLIVSEVYYKPEKDGKLSTNSKQSLKNFPVLIHYFHKDAEKVSGTKRSASARTSTRSAAKRRTTTRRRRRYTDDDSEEDEADSEVELGDDDSDDDTPSRKRTRRSTSAAASTTSTSATNKGAAHASLTFASASGSNADAPPEGLTRAPPPLLNMDALGGVDFGGLFGDNDDEEANDAPLIDDVTSISDLLERDHVPGVSVTADGATPMLNAAGTQQVVSAPDSQAKVVSYAPDCAHSGDTCRVLVVVDDLVPAKGRAAARVHAAFEDRVEVECTRVSANVYEFEPPTHAPGVVYFWLQAKVGSGASKTVRYTQPQPFFFTPSDDRGRLSLAFSELSTVPDDWVRRFHYSTRELDLSNNRLRDLKFLDGFTRLTSLVLDSNEIDSRAEWAPLPLLTTLSLNRNRIADLKAIVERIRVAFPSLQYLSLLGNECCPFFTATSEEYNKYRIYVVSRLRHLKSLDSRVVTLEERQMGMSVM